MEHKPVKLTRRMENVSPNSVMYEVSPKAMLPDCYSKLDIVPTGAEPEAFVTLDTSTAGLRPMDADSTAAKQRGRPFVAGVSGNPNGRPKGSRNKLTETFLNVVTEDFAQNGLDAIERVRQQDPVMYLRIVGSLVPRELILQREREPDVDYSQLTDDEIVELVASERKRARVRQILQCVGELK